MCVFADAQKGVNLRPLTGVNMPGLFCCKNCDKFLVDLPWS